MSEQKLVDEEAAFQLACAMQYIDSLRSVLYVLRDRLDEQAANKQYANVAELAIANADDWHNQLDVEREILEKRTDSAFGSGRLPPNTDSSNHGVRLSGVDLAHRILAAREHAELSQAELAKMVGIQQGSVSQLELGITKRTAYLAEIARACSVDVNWLAFGSEGGQ